MTLKWLDSIKLRTASLLPAIKIEAGCPPLGSLSRRNVGKVRRGIWKRKLLRIPPSNSPPRLPKSCTAGRQGETTAFDQELGRGHLCLT